MKQRTKNRVENERRWRAHVQAAERYPGTAAEYCRRRGISGRSLGYWRRKIREEDARRAPARKPEVPGFVAVEILPPVTRESRPEVHALPDAKWVAELILHLSGRPHAGGGR